MNPEITITITGEVGAGKSTLLWEIVRALAKAGIRCGIHLQPGNVRVPDDMLLGKRLDVIAKRVNSGQLMVNIKEVTLNRSRHEDDIPF